MRAAGFLALTVMLSSLPSPAAAEPGRRVGRDVSYVENGDPAQRLDLRYPPGAGPFPIVILVHGGGWSGGDKAGADKPGSGADITPWFEPLAAAGFLSVSINYRLAPAHPWPACLDDVRAAVAWVRSHAHEFGGDAERLAIVGHSAGGHLALLAASPGPDGVAPVRAVVGCAAVNDLVADTRRRGGPSSSLQALFGIGSDTTPEVLERLAAVSPIHHLRSGYPPTLLIHGDADKTVPLDQSLDWRERARGFGVDCELLVLPGAGHRLTEWTAKEPAWTGRWTDWLRSKLGPTKTTP